MHTLTLRDRGMDKQLQIPDDCKIVLRNDQPGTLADIQTGNHVTVTYETPGNTPTAREIAQTSIAFTGTLTAIDLEEKTLKAKALFNSMRFNVADNCAIVINGKPDGQLSDLKPDDKLTFSYDEINGVNVVNRIAPAEAQPSSVASRTPMTGN
jgi:Cu/Ag efflux protein CusF